MNYVENKSFNEISLGFTTALKNIFTIHATIFKKIVSM